MTSTRVSLRASGRQALLALVSALAGAACGAGMRIWANRLGVEKALWSVDLSQLMSTVMIAGAVFLAALAADRRRLGRMLEAGAETPASAFEVRQTLLQAAVLLVAGVALSVPTMAAPFARAHPETQAAFLAGAAGLLGLQTLLNLAVWRSADDVVRDLALKGVNLAFWVAQSLFFLWAAADRLGIRAPFTPWDGYVLLMAIYLLCSAGLSARAAPSRASLRATA